MSDEAQGAKRAKAALTRRQFTPKFKSKVVREAAATSMADVIRKYKLPGSSREWAGQFAPTKAAVKKTNGAAKAQLGPTREAIVYLRHAERAFDAGKGKRGRLLASLALSTLVGD